MKKYTAFIFLVVAMSMQAMEKRESLLSRLNPFKKRVFAKTKKPQSFEEMEKCMVNNVPVYRKYLEEKEKQLKELEKEKNLEDKVEKTREFYLQYSGYNEDYAIKKYHNISDIHNGAQLLVLTVYDIPGAYRYYTAKYYRIENTPCTFLVGKVFIDGIEKKYGEYPDEYIYHREDYAFKNERQKKDTCNRCIQKMRASLEVRKQLVRDFEKVQKRQPIPVIDEVLKGVREKI